MLQNVKVDDKFSPALYRSRPKENSMGPCKLTAQLLEQRQDGLRRLIRNRQNARACADQDLISRQITGFLGKIQISNRRFRGDEVLHRDRELIHVGIERVLLKGTETPSKRRDLLNGFFDDKRRP